MLTVGSSYAQTVEQGKTLDSLKSKLHADSLRIFRFQKVRSYFAIDRRNSFIKNNAVQINGFQVGVLLFEKHTVGFGSYNINTHASRSFREKEKSYPIDLALNVTYVTAFYQYTLIDKRYIEVDIPVELGYGSFQYTARDKMNDSVLQVRPHGNILPMGAGLNVVLKPFRWVGLSGTAGYRYVKDVGDNLQKVNVNFNGFYYSLGIWVDIRQIVRDMRYYIIKKPKYRKNVRTILAN